MLEIRGNCELCDRDLPPESTAARICSYECTFCEECVAELENVCPNCGGGFERRPIRPRRAHRAGVGLAHQPASGRRVVSARDREEIGAFVAGLRKVPPGER